MLSALRKQVPERERPFHVPGGPVLPLLAALSVLFYVIALVCATPRGSAAQISLLAILR
ncbi:MAG: hypothetical protein M3042_04580 [Actinomycetota bacterium]|nr:hypothetical protein [Actinomycetota bacterium]